MPDTLQGKTIFITGGSRGIGKAIGLRAARDGANIVIAAKSDKPHPKLPGTIHSAAEEIRSAGGGALAIKMDVRDEHQVQDAMHLAAATYGGIDALINNASAITLKGTLELPMKRFDLMFGVNVRGTYAASQAALPFLIKADNPHILNLAPPLNLDPKWFKNHTAYTMSKYGMSMCVLGMAAEFADRGVAVNALWPQTVIATAALAMLGGAVNPANCRTPEIMADAAHCMLTKNSQSYSGNFAIDEDVLKESGVTDFSSYAVKKGEALLPDLFLD